MLFTRCPDCQTTFRVTAGPLLKAGGKVRCSRCDVIFVTDDGLNNPTPTTEISVESAVAPEEVLADWATDHASSTDGFVLLESTVDAMPDEDSAESELADAEDTADDSPDVEDAANGEPDGLPALEDLDEALTTTASIPDTDGPQDDWTAFFKRVSEAQGAATNAVAQLQVTAEDLEDSSPAPDQDLTPEQIDVTLSGDHELESQLAALTKVVQEPEQSGRRTYRWLVGAIVLTIALFFQTIHYLRADLATHPVIGSAVQSAYGIFSVWLTPEWDLSQYEILDWVATAESVAASEDTLSIAARIHNNGPDAQPYPSIYLQLKDRWDQTVGSRIFAPDEYLPSDHGADGLMAAGTTVPVKLDLVDRNEDAYSFELDVCIEAAAGSIACVSDTVFE